MAKWEVLICIAFTTLVCSSEVDDLEQKKRGVGKGTSLNSITTGAQKQDYTYSIYSQNPSSQGNSANPVYQSQVPNSFYPSQGSSQYYSSSNSPTDTSSSSAYSQQPQVNLIPPATTSQFVPINFVPNPGYQSKYQIVPPKTATGNIQLAILQQPNTYASQPQVHYPQQLFIPNPSSQIGGHQNQLVQSYQPQSQYTVPNYQPLQLSSYLNQPSTMLLFAQPNPSLYNNLLYPNPVQSFYNYYPTNSQAKYSLSYAQQPGTTEYDKLQGPITQNISKEDNEIGAHSNDYSSDVNSSYKNTYTASRTSYSKL